MRVLRAWLFRKRAIEGASAIDLDVVELTIAREESAVRICTVQARTIELQLVGVRGEVHAALTDEHTPGIITREESAHLTRQLLQTAQRASQHTKHLESLA